MKFIITNVLDGTKAEWDKAESGVRSIDSEVFDIGMTATQAENFKDMIDKEVKTMRDANLEYRIEE